MRYQNIINKEIINQSSREDCRLLFLSLPPVFQQLAGLLLDGWTEREIASLLNTSQTSVGRKRVKLQKWIETNWFTPAQCIGHQPLPVSAMPVRPKVKRHRRNNSSRSVQEAIELYVRI